MYTLEPVAEGILMAKNEGSEPILYDTQSGLDLIASVWHAGEQTRLIVSKEDIAETFFDLSSGVAGEILQKLVNYKLRMAIVGDFSKYTSKSLKDFIYESNKGKVVYFAATQADAVAHLTD